MAAAQLDSARPAQFQPEQALVFIGFMGSGKSTAARRVAERLGGTALDSDRLLEERLGHSIAEEIDQFGEGAFRAQEETLVCELLARAAPSDAISLGGGAILSAKVREALTEHLPVYLEGSAQSAWERMGPGRERRPLARDLERFSRLHDERAPLYERLARAILPAGALQPRASGTDDSGEQHVAVRALASLCALTTAPAGSYMHWAWATDGEYPAVVGSGLYARRLALAGKDGAEQSQSWTMRSFWPQALSSGQSYCISDSNVSAHFGAAIGPCFKQIDLLPGEQNKTLAAAQKVWTELAGAGMTRADHLIALGGGVVGDLAGFCAATYQRGVPIIQLPTTVVGQVDSAYGGKTGVDLPEAKNYVGAYHQPAAVIADLDTLSTLPEPELNAGWVEVLKTALIAGGDLWRAVSSGELLDAQTIFACARTKLAIVAQDERDAGLRQVLNLGHTVGHAIESASHYKRYRHGEAVGLGLLATLTLSGSSALRDQVREMLQARSLPVTIEDLDPAQVVAAVAFDKKRLGDKVPFVLLDTPGSARYGCEIDPKELEAAIRELFERRPASESRPGQQPLRSTAASADVAHASVPHGDAAGHSDLSRVPLQPAEDPSA